jgi:hypothetical protein
MGPQVATVAPAARLVLLRVAAVDPAALLVLLQQLAVLLRQQLLLLLLAQRAVRGLTQWPREACACT